MAFNGYRLTPIIFMGRSNTHSASAPMTISVGTAIFTHRKPAIEVYRFTQPWCARGKQASVVKAAIDRIRRTGALP